jgi:hypothetical protein
MIAGVLAAQAGDRPIAPTASEPPSDSQTPAPKRPLPVHPDAAALQRATSDAVLAMIQDDTVAARAALDRIEAGCRRLSREADSAYPEDIVVYDKAFHVTLDRMKEFAARGDAERTFEQTYWMQKACRICHGLARAGGFLAPRPASGNGSSPRP